jgi:Glycerophosphoryl diester phosphodiesterase
MTPPAPPATEKPLAAKVQVIGHRGACAWEPEHTLASYARAMDDGADFIEPDLVMTRDGVMVARHENDIGDTTDVASHPEFASRRARRIVDGRAVTGWFTEDFTLAELKTLRARERLPELRGTGHDGRWQILAFDEVVDFVAAGSARLGRVIGIMPEIKHGAYFRRIDRPMEDALLATLVAHAYTRSAPVAIQSFEVANLQYLRDRLGGAQARQRHPNIRLLQLLDEGHRQPYDVATTGGRLTYAQMMTPAGLREVARRADAIGPALSRDHPAPCRRHAGAADHAGTRCARGGPGSAALYLAPGEPVSGEGLLARHRSAQLQRGGCDGRNARLPRYRHRWVLHRRSGARPARARRPLSRDAGTARVGATAMASGPAAAPKRAGRAAFRSCRLRRAKVPY